MKRFSKALCLAFVLSVLLSFAGFAAVCEEIPSQVLRLHVLANSDSAADQNLKLKVRDRILKESAGVMEGIGDLEGAKRAAASRMPQLQKAAQDEVRRRGSEDPVTVSLGKTYFPTRVYGGVTLPAGIYDALRVTIGSGRGHNWWCVIFPALCLPAAEDEEQLELEDVLSPNELRVVRGSGGYEVKFKTVEYYERIKSWLGGR